ncbi:uroporphyrinogen-III C-methyltransferase [Inhella gelatinilytica]|uniref:Uroporphyrinogen-III C-methyltransferase n=1 Tax=Inhella gelatinilytica TaxID=2795030 RepID=A0A931NDT4_9BURK|nr:uroporphyrinogen-III C-methyltransferase [Inhella gelatinilytica]MBH9553427.1 uroporphyrinogen-III C-methyltransferase [Inhella gelatinilytica]
MAEETVQTPESPTAPAVAPPVLPAVSTPPAPAAPSWVTWLTATGGLLSVGAVALAWQSQSRLHDLEQELVRRQATAQTVAAEARQSAQQTQEQVRDLAAKLALAEARLAEVSIQRSQLEELLSQLSRSRDENIVGDLEASLRLAGQQAQFFGSVEPLVNALRQADDRLQRHKQPRLEGVRRAVLRDLDRIKALGAVDSTTLALRLDEVARLVDEVPLLVESQRVQKNVSPAVVAAPATGQGLTWQTAQTWVHQRAREVWSEFKGLVRVTRIEAPEAMLLAPDQVQFLRDNLKLRLLNARLALMSRQYDSVQSDIRSVLQALERHADARQRRAQVALEVLRQVQQQAKPIQWPRPEDSLAALAAVAGVR